MKKQLIMTALGLALAGGVLATSANAAPISGSVGKSEVSTNLTQKAHYEGSRHHRHGWRKWRPRMFGYSRARSHHQRHQHHSHRRHYN